MSNYSLQIHFWRSQPRLLQRTSRSFRTHL